MAGRCKKRSGTLLVLVVPTSSTLRGEERETTERTTIDLIGQCMRAPSNPMFVAAARTRMQPLTCVSTVHYE
jgi:hypothetical protein